MQTYEEIVRHYRKTESGEVLENLSPPHAKILFENLLEAAVENGEKVCIYSGTLNKEFYEQLTEAIKDTLQKLQKGDVLVAVAKPHGENQVGGNSFADAVKAFGGELKEGVADLVGKDFPHFILVGDRRYRLEKDDETKEAIACFNDPRLGGLLAQASKKLMAGSAPIQH